MFDLLDRPLVWIPVKWPGLIQKEESAVAEAVEHEVEIQVEILDRDEMESWGERGSKGPVIPEGTAPEAAKALQAADGLAIFKEVAKAWRKIGAGGKSLAFNDENIAKLLRVQGFGAAFGQAYVDAWNGRIATRSGNSEGSPKPGRADGQHDETAEAART